MMDRETPCGRYIKYHNEPFFRRKATLEPTQTPERYYESRSAYNEGKAASATAWESWKRETIGAVLVSRTPWFEFVDTDLRAINRLIQSSNQQEFYHGLRKIHERLAATYDASAKLGAHQNAQKAPSSDSARWTERLRRGPAVLATIFTQLKSVSTKTDGQKALASLCDDRLSSTMMTTNSPTGESSRRRQVTPPSSGQPPAYIPLRSKDPALRPALPKPKPPEPLILPAPASSRTIVYMAGRGTAPPIYIPTEQFHDTNNEHGVERPPTYTAEAEKVPPPSMWIPKNQLGEDTVEMRREGRQNRIQGVRRTMLPNTVLRGDLDSLLGPLRNGG